MITRLKPGANWQQADAEVNRAWAMQAAQYAARNQGSHIRYYSVPLQQGQASELKPRALALQIAAGFILLIACANLAGLTLVRVARRTPEIATRLALGGSRWQVQKQLWMENLLLAAGGGAAEWPWALWHCEALLSLLPEDYLPVTGVGLDGRVMWIRTGGFAVYECAVRDAAGTGCRKVDLRASMANRAVRGRAPAAAAGVDRRRSRADSGAAGGQRTVDSDADPPGDAAAGIQSAKCNDRQGFTG